MSVDEIGLSAAVLLLAAAVVLVFRRSRDRNHRLERGLAAEDPTQRLEALAQVERDGVAAHAERLLAHVAQEKDEAVLAEMARLVRHHLWEPLESEAQAGLRAWALTTSRSGTGADIPASTSLGDFERALGERVRRFSVTTGSERFEVVRDDVETAGRGAGR